jgi:prepilin-type N-terminal cleavage/methylation domain-containing protein
MCQELGSDTRSGWLRTRAGFTFLELTIVILILGIITLMAIPAMNAFFSEETVNAAADAAATAIHYARATAITTGVPHRVIFDPEADCFQVEKHVSGVPPEEVFEAARNPLTKRDYLVSFTAEESASQGVEVHSALFGEANYVRFDNLGAPMDTGSVTLKYGSRYRNIGVTATSCQISSEIPEA